MIDDFNPYVCIGLGMQKITSTSYKIDFHIINNNIYHKHITTCDA